MAIYNKKHGLSNSKIYRVWRSMKGRCYNPKDAKYSRYGNRGIFVCDEWKNCFENFYKWAVLNGYKEGLSIDRINNDGNYEPSNCRWANRFTQANNTSKNFFIEYNGIKKSASEWAREIGVSDDTIKWRLKKYGLCEKVFSSCNYKFCNKSRRLSNLQSKQ